MPVLHLYGQPQDPAFLAAQEEFAEHDRGSPCGSSPGLTHFAMIETPEEVADEIEAFVRAA